MQATVIKHKYTMRMAVAIFWRIWLNTIKLPMKPNWSKCEWPDFPMLGYDKVGGQPEKKLFKREYCYGEYWQKQRVFQFFSGRTLIVEVLLVGIETLPPQGNSFREWHWAPAAARYRPIQTKRFPSGEEAERFYEDMSSENRALSGQFYFPYRVTYFGDWVNVDPKQFAPLQPRTGGWSAGLELPSPVWPN